MTLRHSKIPLLPVALMVTALVAVLAMALAPGADAAVPPPLAQVPEDGKPGEAAGRLDFPIAIAVDPKLPGHVYIGDRENARLDEFTAWGEFVRAWGWGVLDGKEELETCTTQTGCRSGISGEGEGEGQIFFSEGLTVDGQGDVYAINLRGYRVQKFDPEGHLLFRFGSKGTGPGQLSLEAYPGRLAASPTTGDIFLGEEERIQVFEPNGSFKEEIEMPSGKKVVELAVGADGKLYVAFAGEHEVHKIEPHGPIATFLTPVFSLEDPNDKPGPLALDGSSHLYVESGFPSGLGTAASKIFEFDPAGNCLDCGTEGEEEGGEAKPGFDRSLTSRIEAIAAGSACGSDLVYAAHFGNGGFGPLASFFRAFGDHPNAELCPPPPAPPSIDDQFASAVEATEARLVAKINPHFWSGSVGTTTYYLQYATQACFEAGGWSAPCVEAQPTPPGAVLGGGAVGEDVAALVHLEDLSPGTAYRYRFVAEGSGAPGEPVSGVGGRPGIPGTDATFTTFRATGVEPCTANEGSRTGAAALLPDCRAYEMVSPVDKEGGDIVVGRAIGSELPAVLAQSASSGARLAYGSLRSFGGAASAPITTQYVAARRAGEAWVTHPISPPRGRNFYGALPNFETEFKAFSPDLCQAWFQSFAELPAELEPLAPTGVTDLFDRSDEECGGPKYEALNTVQPPNVSGPHFHVELQGLSADGRTAVFEADDELAPGGHPGVPGEEEGNSGPIQLYGEREGDERFLCVLPGGAAWSGSCTAGMNFGAGLNSRRAAVTGALSSDGQSAYWTAQQFSGGPGPIYLRENPFGEGTECAEEASPCTAEVSREAEEEGGSLGKGSTFWAAASDGSRALFTTGPDPQHLSLYEFNRAEGKDRPIAGEVLGLMGQSADAVKVYLASREAKGGPNAEGKSAVAGEANLYLYEDGQFQYIGALAGGDLPPSLSPLAPEPRAHTARVSADGAHTVFMSVAPLTGYDNTDQTLGKADAEVYLYDAAANGGEGRLVCASCNPSGARPRGQLAGEGTSIPSPVAAKIPVPENPLYASRVLSEDGRRLFFESYDSLTPRDTNGQKDVYQWEEAGAGACTQSSPSFSPAGGGCVDLISSGRSVRESSFLDASPTGDDAFFATLASLLPQDPGLVDVYDARVGGGLPAPAALPASCEGEACQPPSQAPEDPTPASAFFEGAGNPVKSTPRPCRKGRVRRHGKCIRKRRAGHKPAHHRRRASHHRRSAR